VVIRGSDHAKSPGNTVVSKICTHLLCAAPSSYESACVSVDVVAGHVTPVNLKLLFGPFQFIVFDPLTHTQLNAATIYPGS
jgi:Rieske Fe-S protein